MNAGDPSFFPPAPFHGYSGWDPGGWLEKEWHDVQAWPTTLVSHAVDQSSAGQHAASVAKAASSAAEDVSQAAQGVSQAAAEMAQSIRVFKMMAVGGLAIAVMGLLYVVLDR